MRWCPTLKCHGAARVLCEAGEECASQPTTKPFLATPSRHLIDVTRPRDFMLSLVLMVMVYSVLARQYVWLPLALFLTKMTATGGGGTMGNDVGGYSEGAGGGHRGPFGDTRDLVDSHEQSHTSNFGGH